MRRRDVVERIKILGLPEEEAEAYVQLAVSGPCRASALAEALGVQRNEAYRILDSLVHKGFATRTFTRPAQFQAAPIEAAYGQVQAEQRGRMEDLERARPGILSVFEGLAARVPAGAEATAFRLVGGGAELRDLAARMVGDARREMRALHTAATWAAGAGELSALWDPGLRRAREGVRLRLLACPSPEVAARIATLPPSAGIAVRYLPQAPEVRFLLRDEAELLVVVDPGNAEGPRGRAGTALWTDARALVATLALAFEALWATAGEAALDPGGAPPQAGPGLGMRRPTAQPSSGGAAVRPP